MCWNGQASAALATAGIAGTLYAAYKKEPVSLWTCLGYFSLMEILQAYTYSVIDQCNNPSNQVATLLGYLHITFQPFFINAVSLHFIPQRIAKKIAPAAYAVCFAAAIMMIIKLYPFGWAGHCKPGRPMCGALLCSIHGSWHIAWSLPINDVGEHFSWYLLAGFIVPMLYGSWRFTLYHLLAGPLLALATTRNMNEWPAVWCLLSIAFMLVVVKTPIRRVLYVKNYWWFKMPEAEPEPQMIPVRVKVENR
jgi:hypothetical protein